MKDEKLEKLLEYFFEFIQSGINIWLIVLLWPQTKIWAILVALYEMLRISAMFKLGEKAQYHAQSIQTDVLTGEFFKKKKK